MTAAFVARFWSRVDTSAGPNSCWPWAKGRNAAGYGRVSVNGKMMLAHRMAFELSTGLSPDDSLVLHHCDNPICCNPAHLWVGTQHENIADMVKKRRHGVVAHPERYFWHVLPEQRPRGSRNGYAKLTEKGVEEIRSTYRAGKITQTALAREYNVSQHAIWSVLSKRTWKHVSSTAEAV